MPDSPILGEGAVSLRTEMLKASPKILLALIGLLAILLLKEPISAFMDRSTEIGIGPVTLKAAEAKLSTVKVDVTPQSPYFSPDQIKELTALYSGALAGGRRATVLWVDDNPRNNKDLVDFLGLFGVNVVIARSYPEALQRLDERSYNVVISDWSRPNDEVEIRAKAKAKRSEFWGSGPQLADTMAKSGCGRRVIIFSSESGDDKPIPPGVTAATNNFYDLLAQVAHHLTDAVPPCYVSSA